MYASLLFFLSLLFLLLPLGLDTLGISLSLGMKSTSRSLPTRGSSGRGMPLWLRTALLFALAEMLMPIIGLLIGAALSTLLNEVMHYLGALLLLTIGIWECMEEGREYVRKRTKRQQSATRAEPQPFSPGEASQSTSERFQWKKQLLLALSVSLDELAVGFSFGSLRTVSLSPTLLCVLIGLQGFLMAILGLVLGRTLRFRLKALQELSELLSAALLIGLGIWFLFS